MPGDIKYLVEKRRVLVSRKDPWIQQFSILGKYIYTKKQNFDSQVSEGSFLNDGMINDSTAVLANNAMASAIMGALWRNGGKTFRIKRPRNIPNTEINNKYYQYVNTAMFSAMEAPGAGFEVALHEDLCEEGAFGTGCVALFQGDYENPLNFLSWSLQNIYIAQGPDNNVDTVYYDEQITIGNLAERYGRESLPEDLGKKYDDEQTRSEKVLLTVGIEPRPSKERKGGGVFGMPIASYHFLPEQNHKLKESGFSEMPAFVSRWYKLANEEYGRSPGMDALPAVMQINALRESFLVGTEKKVEPAVWVLDDGSLGAGVVDTSAGGLSVFNSMGRTPGQPPLGVIFDVGELNSTAAAIEETKQIILQHFLIDRLYDLNNKSRMTLGEAEMRYQMRSDALSAVYARKTAQLLNPMIKRSYNILFDMGLLGIQEGDDGLRRILESHGIEPVIIPPDVVEAILLGRNIYDIEYISPAAHIMREEEYRGLMTTVENAIALQQAGADTMIKLNVDRVLEWTGDLTGAPEDILYADDIVKVRRETRDKAIELAQKVQLAEMASKAGKNVAESQAVMASAGERRQ